MPPHARMMQHILGKWISRPIGLVSRLGIVDLLAHAAGLRLDGITPLETGEALLEAVIA